VGNYVTNTRPNLGNYVTADTASFSVAITWYQPSELLVNGC
jgi:hypothetical protein